MNQTVETLIASTNRMMALAHDNRFDAQQRRMFAKSARWAAKQASDMIPPANVICIGQF